MSINLFDKRKEKLIERVSTIESEDYFTILKMAIETADRLHVEGSQKKKWVINFIVEQTPFKVSEVEVEKGIDFVFDGIKKKFDLIESEDIEQGVSSLFTFLCPCIGDRNGKKTGNDYTKGEQTNKENEENEVEQCVI